MGRTCINDHRPEHSIDSVGSEGWLNNCAQCELERLREWLEGDALCPCCQELRVCRAECTFAVDCPSEAERMFEVRSLLYGTKDMNREKNRDQRMRKYGITADEYDRLLAEQGGGCAICKRIDSGDRRGGRFHVDHCHNSAMVRGLLCSGCNMGIGKFGDDAERLERAAMYLRARIR